MASLATPQAAIDALDTSPHLTVYVDDVLTDVVAYTGQHTIDRTPKGWVTP